MFQKLNIQAEISVNLVRSVQDLQECDALVIPGGGKLLVSPRLLPLFSSSLAESTTIALLAKLSGLLDPLREFSKTKPVWGSCAGAILMSRNVTNTKKGGQDLLGRLSVTTARNGWGSQVGRLAQNHCTISVDGYLSRSNPLRPHSWYNRCHNRISHFKECSFVPRYCLHFHWFEP
jgi:5'-phosphate synthase pdxT subunit